MLIIYNYLYCLYISIIDYKLTVMFNLYFIDYYCYFRDLWQY